MHFLRHYVSKINEPITQTFVNNLVIGTNPTKYATTYLATYLRFDGTLDENLRLTFLVWRQIVENDTRPT